MKKYFIITLFFILSSCIYTITDYTPNTKQEHNISLSNNNKKDITFKLSILDQDNIDYNEKFKKKLVKDIRKALEDSKLFRKVSYIEDAKDANEYYYWFTVKFTKTYGDNFFLLYFVIPSKPQSFNVDITMHVAGYNDIYSITTTETIKNFAWLPFIFLNPFLNLNKAVNNVEEKVFNYFINEIINNKLY